MITATYIIIALMFFESVNLLSYAVKNRKEQPVIAIVGASLTSMAFALALVYLAIEASK